MEHWVNRFLIFGAKYLYLIVMGIALFYFLKKSEATRKRIIILSIIVLPATYLIAKIMGFFYYDPRPFVLGNFTPLIHHAPDNGFPSDHTLLTADMASVLYLFSKKTSMVLWMFTLIVGISRVYAGLHHPIDVFGSMVIAIITTVSACLLIKT